MNRNKRAASNLSRRSWEGTASVWTGHCKIQLSSPNTIIDILSRLPIKTNLNCKRVCKGWLRLISHPRFVELHLARSSTGILIKTIPSVNDSRKISLTRGEQRGRAPFRLDKLTFTLKFNLSSSKFILVNSCNDLLCSSGVEKGDPIWARNPILGEYVTIPLASKGRQCGSYIGLGFCAVMNRYKLIQTFYPKVRLSGSHYMDAEKYYMDTGTWRRIGYAPSDPVASPFNCFLHGSLHWVPIVGNSSEYVCSFNFEIEEFGLVPQPPCLDESKREFSDYLKAGLLKAVSFYVFSLMILANLTYGL